MAKKVYRRKTGRAKGYTFKPCDKCHKKYRTLWRYRGKSLCFSCYRKSVKLFMAGSRKIENVKKTKNI